MDATETSTPAPDEATELDAPDALDTENAEDTEDTEGADQDDESVLLRKTALIERVVEATGQKRKDVKPILEATLQALGDALVAGEDLQMMPMGKVKIHKRKVVNGDDVMMLKMRRNGKPTPPLEEDED